ncbi:polyprotein [Phytophthora megakarya]|uniref:Polyprotein n=1 Tax=Phytophthora megakarya TaxID=4795 RepID=A0A225W4H3_9STRA|nr:polyprotein [Phytophthora megakarya]
MELLTGKRALSCRNGSLERYKALLVVICQQIKHVDFDDVFEPVIRLEFLHVLLAIVCIEDIEFDQMDIEAAFLNGILEEEVFTKQPEGMEAPGKEELVYKLLKGLYGLNQVPRVWHKALTEYLEKEGFERLQCEACIYIRVTKGGRAIVAIFADDLLIVTKTKPEVADMEASIPKNMGPVSYILGIRVTRDRAHRKIWFNQHIYAAKIVEKFNLTHAHEVHVP